MITSRWRLSVAAVAALSLAAVALPLHSSSAATSAVHFMGTRQYDAQQGLGIYGSTSPDAGSNLIYHGGPVMQSTSTTYSIFWQPTGSFMDANYKTLIDRYFNDVGGSVVYANDTQYYQVVNSQKQAIVNSSTLGGTWTDTSPYPGKTLSDAQIQAEVSKAMQANGWTASPTHLFFVYIAKGENTCLARGECSFTLFCAYHGYFTQNGQNVFYANMPYDGTNLNACWSGGKSPNNDVDADSAINVTSHEHMEAVTDSITTFVKPTGAWYDRQTSEIGDKCAWMFGNVQSNGQNVVMNGHPYIVQEEWSNQGSTCPSWD